jgi:hypothetical protein
MSARTRSGRYCDGGVTLGQGRRLDRRFAKSTGTSGEADPESLRDCDPDPEPTPEQVPSEAIQRPTTPPAGGEHPHGPCRPRLSERERPNLCGHHLKRALWKIESHSSDILCWIARRSKRNSARLASKADVSLAGVKKRQPQRSHKASCPTGLM